MHPDEDLSCEEPPVPVSAFGPSPDAPPIDAGLLSPFATRS